MAFRIIRAGNNGLPHNVNSPFMAKTFQFAIVIKIAKSIGSCFCVGLVWEAEGVVVHWVMDWRLALGRRDLKMASSRM